MIPSLRLNLPGCCYIYNILRDLYWLTGNIHQAINCHQKSLELANSCLRNSENSKILTYELVMLHYKARFNLGLCNIDILEFNKGLEFFEQIEVLMQDYDPTSYYKENEATRLCCLSLLHSYLSSPIKASRVAEEAYSKLEVSQRDSWSKGYSLLFLGITYKNIKNTERAFEMYNKAIAFAVASKYAQVKAKALIGLAELYRIQQDFDKALSHHLESIELLDKIGAKCDLAEAYFQFGLTYQAMDEAEQSLVYRDKALKFFTEIEAPKQIERVKQAFGANI